MPDELRDAGYILEPAGEGERILPAAITEQLTLTSCGIFELATEGSTEPIAQTVVHSGICPVIKYQFGI